MTTATATVSYASIGSTLSSNGTLSSDEIAFLSDKIELKVRKRYYMIGEDRREDVSQSVLMKLVEHGHKYDPTVGKFSTYLFTIVHREAVKETDTIGDDARNTIQLSALESDDNSDALAAIGGSEELDRTASDTISALMLSLNNREKEVVRLLSDGLNQVEIGLVLGFTKEYARQVILGIRAKGERLGLSAA